MPEESIESISLKEPLWATILPAPRLAIYCGLGALLWLGAALTGMLLTAAILYDIVLLFVAVVDILLSPQPGQLELEREIPHKLNIGVNHDVRLRARNNSSHRVTLTVRDEPPVSWEVDAHWRTPLERADAATEGGSAENPPDTASREIARVPLTVNPGRSGWVIYSVVPTRRGDFEFGALSARYHTILGLWQRQCRVPAAVKVLVYPDNTLVRRYELRLRQGRLRDIGLHLIRLRGRGTEFESLREYTTDDEYKDINWKASARHGKLISTNYEIERDQTVMIALDCGRMMTAMAVTRDAADAARKLQKEGDELASTIVPLSKLDCAINASVLVAHVAASMGDSVGLLLFSDRVLHFVPPRKGRLQTGTIIEALYNVQPSLVEPDYMAAYEYLLTRRVRRSLVITFTDLIDAACSRELLSASGALRRHHNSLCVTINNKDVMEMARLVPEESLEMYEKAMAQRMLAQRDQALEELRRRAVGILDVPAEQLTIATVNRYLDLKSRAAF